MSEKRVEIKSIVKNQLPSFVREDFPLIGEFFEQYYLSQEYQGSATDLLQNIDNYLRLENNYNLVESTTLSQNVSYVDTTIYVGSPNFTNGLPDSYGLVKINDEVILYERKTEISLEGCIRGFSGITSLKSQQDPEEVVFSSTQVQTHSSGDVVENLSILFLKEFLVKIKSQFSPGFESRSLEDDLNQSLFIKRSKDFYDSKGTDESFRILFKSLYGESVSIIKPKDNLLRSSTSKYNLTKDIVVEVIDGDILDSLNQTLYQDEFSDYGIEKAYAPITNIEKIFYDNKEYYKLSLDYGASADINLDGSIFGEFSIHPKTRVISDVNIGQTYINVDSTIGFPNSGTLRIKDLDDVEIFVTYTDKTSTQFMGVEGVSSIISSANDVYLDVYAYTYSKVDGSLIFVRVSPTISDIQIESNTSNFSVNDTIRIKSLGITTSNVCANSFIHNVSKGLVVETIQSKGNSVYSLKTYDTHRLLVGDDLVLSNNLSQSYQVKVISVTSSNTFSIQYGNSIDVSLFYTVERKLNFVETDDPDYQYINTYISDVENTYINKNNEVLIASQSFPNYDTQPVKVNDKKYQVTGSFNGSTDIISFSNIIDHGLYTGDSVYYSPYTVQEEILDSNGFIIQQKVVSEFTNIEEGIYFVERVSGTSIKISRGLSDLNNGIYISPEGNVINNTFQYYNYSDKILKNQNILRKISNPDKLSDSFETVSGFNGILVNGVEILNYKSTDYIRFGQIESISVNDNGRNYDIINPPVVEFSDESGTGASALANVRGSLERIDIIDPGFDYVDIPKIKITGGNGFGAIAEANLKKITHSVSFDATSSSLVGLTTNTVGFSTYHKFRNNEKVIYKTDGQTAVLGLTTDATYYASTIDSHNIKLYETLENSINGIGTVTISDYGVGVHRFESFDKKNVISKISVIDSGSGYENKKRLTLPVGVSPVSDSININSHGYSSREKVVYTTDGTEIGGLSSGTTYIIKKIDNDNFKLAEIGVGNIEEYFYYNNSIFVDFTTSGSGEQIFNYPSISVTVEGNIGVSTLSNQNFNAEIQPIFRGGIESLHLTSGGQNYGSERVLNYTRNPVIELNSGIGAEAILIVNGGVIQEVLVLNGGSGYNSPPNIEISGTGNYALLTPIISNGIITSIKVINGGVGYSDGDSIRITSSGTGATFSPAIKKWTINEFEKSYDLINDDDGLLSVNVDSIQYCHLYAPRRLRRSVFGKTQDNFVKYGVSDLSINSGGEEIASLYHSPIIGWSYDGYPIYGPYGFSSPSGGNITLMRSSYKLTSRTNRPSQLYFPQGFFVDDYEYVENYGDLDEHNGRYCITPDFPNGTYAYFATIESINEQAAPFKNYRKPKFPYLIGNSFKSKPERFNYLRDSNQNNYDFSDFEWSRNVTDLNVSSRNSFYNYIFNPNEYKESDADIKSVTSGSIDSIDIVFGGSNYKVNDPVIFDNSNTGGFGASAKISKILGKEVSSISVATNTIEDVEFSPLLKNSNKFVAISTEPHNLLNGDLINISGLSISNSDLYGSYTIGVTTDIYELNVGMGSTSVTGMTTSIRVTGNFSYPTLKVNDILSIDDEKVKVLSFDANLSEIKILREYDSTTGVSHTASTIVYQNPRYFTFNAKNDSDYEYATNKQIYFDPSNTVGLGTTSGVGITSTLFVGINSITTPVGFITGTSTILTFDSVTDASNYVSGYINIYNSTDSSFDQNKVKIVSSASTSITVDYDTSSLVGSGVTGYLDKWTTLNIPTRSIYLPNHNFATGETLTYSSSGDNPISVSTDGTTSFQLTDNQIVYSVKIDDNLLGISTFKVGLNTDGTYVGLGTTASLLYFTNNGSGNVHSFKSIRSNVVTGVVERNVVTVSTASTHGLSEGDFIDITVKSLLTDTITVKYNDYNGRFIFNPKDFTGSDVNTFNDSIYIENHGLRTGDKVIHTSSSPSGGLVDQKIYYIVYSTKNRIKLAESLYNSKLTSPVVVDITSTSSGTISPINPPLYVVENSEVIFDLSDSSLSSIQGTSVYPTFDFSLYTDSEYRNEFLSSGVDQFFEVVKTGSAGIDGQLRLRIRDSVSKKLYYKFDLINLQFAENSKLNYINDSEVAGHNEINIIKSGFTAQKNITGISSNTFNYNLLSVPEQTSYTSSQAEIEYFTTSTSASGKVEDIVIKSKGYNYKSIPGITSIRSLSGSGAILKPIGKNIGSILKTKINDIGFDFPSDFTLKPINNLTEILFLSPLASFNRIGITSAGFNYNLPPDLIVKDGFNNEVIDDVDLRINYTNSEVEIVKNTNGMNNTTPNIIPISNSNGIGIGTISFDSNTNYVTVGLDTGFSDVFPFSIGEKVLIENISVGVGSTAKGYNSSNYNYNIFPVVEVTPNLGGIGSVTYDLTDFLNSGEYPGTFDSVNSRGTIVPERYFPIFDISLKTNNFIVGEKIIVDDNEVGYVESWVPKLNLLKVASNTEINNGNLIYGETSNNRATVIDKNDYYSEFHISSSSIVENGWSNNIGFLNDNLQRTSDNGYYQQFSYSLKSKVPYQIWNEPVSSLNHTSGFRKYSDYIIENQKESPVSVAGISSTIIITDIVREIDYNCITDFDNVIETTVGIENKTFSNEVIFKNRILSDYFQSVGNRVLTIDDVSDQFNSEPRFTRFSVVDEFVISQTRSRKYFIYVSDRRFSLERQLMALSLIHDGSQAFLNQYGRVESYLDLGSFDFRISGDRGQILFYPEKYEVNDYNLSYIAYNVQDSISGIGSTTFGDIVTINNFEESTSSGATASIIGISSTNRSAKILVQITNNTEETYELNEISIIHDGSDIDILDYGQLNTSTFDDLSISGFGTYSGRFDSSDIKIDFYPRDNSSYTINSVVVSIGDTTTTGVGTQFLGSEQGDLTLTIGGFESSYTNIAASGSPTENVVASFPYDFSASYLIASVEDLTTNEYQMSELMLVNDQSQVYLTEFAILQTGSGIGTFGSNIVSGQNEIYFTPLSGREVEVRLFQNYIKLASEDFNNPSTSMQNADISVGFGFYQGTFSDIRRDFYLEHDGEPIFERFFDGSNSGIVSVTSNRAFIPNHFFVSGEEVSYSTIGSGTTNSVGIATTTISGYGSTDKLPSNLYIIKIDESYVQFSDTAENALKTTPVPLEITSLGIGTYHKLTSKNQNSRVLVAVDNYIQSPVVESSVTTTVGNLDVSIFDNSVTFSGITSFYSGDLIKINDEIMKINTVGFGSTNVITVNRPWMGTGLSTHSSGDTITKISGNYNIVDNIINFVDAPKGKVPIGTITNPPDQRDWTGITTYSSFQGRTFLRSGIPNSSDETYSKNYIFDDLSEQFDAQTSDFTLTSNGSNITGFSTDNAIILVNDIFQVPQGIQGYSGDYNLSEPSGTELSFTGTATSVAYDPNNASLPVGGVIVSVGSTNGFGYQPLVAAGGTATVSAAGTIQVVSIGNSGSGYRSGIQTVVNVGVQTLSTGTPNIEFIGTAAVSGGHIVSIAITNPGAGYTHTNPPSVVFDNPLSYSNIPLVYSSSSISGYGTEATVDIVVGQGSSIVDFSFKNFGYAYGQGEILTIDIGGTTGIPTDPTKSYDEFQLTIDTVYNDKFSGWTVGEFEVLDRFDNYFDGSTKSFSLRLNESPVTIRAEKGSNIDIQSVILIFINDILQYPGDSYQFNGGSVVTFSEPPKVGDTSKVIFYKGSGDIDVTFTDVLELVKNGDTIFVGENKETCSDVTYQDERVVSEIISSSSLETNAYNGPGITGNPDCQRPLTLCIQTEDKVINGKYVTKDRIIYEPLINPTSYAIQSVGLASTAVFVQSVKTFFDPVNENNTSSATNTIYIVSQNSTVAASATAVVSAAGTISSIVLSDGGNGYVSNPEISISNPIGLGITYRAEARTSVTSGSVTSVEVTSPGSGYTNTNPPEVLIEIPKLTIEENITTSYEGDFGSIVGIKTTNVGVSTGLVFDLLIPENSYLRDTSIVGTAITVSQLDSGYYFTAYNTNIGSGVTSIYSDGSILGIGTQYLDNVYEVSSVSIAQTEAPGYGTTHVAQVTVSISDYNSLTGTGYSGYFGDYSWGKIILGDRVNASEFEAYTQNGIGGISTSAIVARKNPLKYINYL